MDILQNDIDSFFQVPFEIYNKSMPHVSYLKSDLKRFLSTKNPLFSSERDFEYFTVIRDHRPVGRIVAHIHRASNQVHNLKRAYFGYLDCIDDLDVAKALMQKAEAFGQVHGCDEIIGNFNLTAMQQIGVLTKIHKNYHYTDQVFSPVYISQLLEKLGYTPTFPCVTHEVNLADINPEFLLGEKQKAILQNKDFTFDELKTANLDQIIEAMRICLNGGFVDNPMFVPLTWDEIYFQAKDMMLILDREISVIAKYRGEPVGTIVCIPNLIPMLQDMGSQFGLLTPYYFLKHKFRRESATIIYYSVLKEFHSQGLNAVMLYLTVSALKKRGYQRFGGTWISTENKASMRQAEKLGAEVMHELSLYRKALHEKT
jgi:GNAT superfamily N-acetyltransferase